GMPVLVEKGRALTRRLETELAQALPTEVLEIITPREPASRGQQLSIRTLRGPRGSDLIALLGKKGIVVDFREPDILRVTPVPLYNNENDIHRLVAALKEIHS
ncbi:MAG: kynureninase, partial [Bdellovibrionota bacterium]